MNIRRSVVTFTLAWFASAISLSAQVEPNAGAWKTWILGSGQELRVPPPPDKSDTAVELTWLKNFTSEARQQPEILRQVRYWLAGSPSYRWVGLALSQMENEPLTNPRNVRAMALMNIAVYDAIVTAWNSKYAYTRQRPSVTDSSIQPLVDVPRSPCYPSEVAVAAGAASEILAYAWPAHAAQYRELSEEAARASMAAGIQYPSDVVSGLELGRAVAAKVLAQAASDGSDAVWTGSVPTGPGVWTGVNPVEPMAGTWKTWVLRSGDQLRPEAPIAYDSVAKRAELDLIKSFPRTFATNEKAFYYQSGEGIFTVWYQYLNQRLFESRQDQNPPRAARTYALAAIAHNDASVACWDAKYAYWAPRPFQLDASVTTLFTTPNHPSYPAAHGCYSGAIARVIGRLFPDYAEFMDAKSNEAAQSRIWAGIHFPSDVEAGLDIGRKTADMIIEWASNDGSQR